MCMDDYQGRQGHVDSLAEGCLGVVCWDGVAEAQGGAWQRGQIGVLCLGFSVIASCFWCTSVELKFRIGVLGLLVNLVFMCCCAWLTATVDKAVWTASAQHVWAWCITAWSQTRRVGRGRGV